jgi:hypothetical protein
MKCRVHSEMNGSTVRIGVCVGAEAAI